MILPAAGVSARLARAFICGKWRVRSDGKALFLVSNRGMLALPKAKSGRSRSRSSKEYMHQILSRFAFDGRTLLSNSRQPVGANESEERARNDLIAADHHLDYLSAADHQLSLCDGCAGLIYPVLDLSQETYARSYRPYRSCGPGNDAFFFKYLPLLMRWQSMTCR